MAGTSLILASRVPLTNRIVAVAQNERSVTRGSGQKCGIAS